MARSIPYQPLLLRLLHGVSALLVMLALISGYWVYNTFDGRFGKLPLPWINDIQGLHGTFGLFFLILLPAFALYSFHAGQKRLIQPDTLQQATRLGQPMGWISLQRIINTWMLLASVLAVLSGRLMKEEWLPNGELYHAAYSFHLIAWAVMFLSLALHLLMSVKVGGVPLLLSMLSWQVRSQDHPRHWPSRLREWLRAIRSPR